MMADHLDDPRLPGPDVQEVDAAAAAASIAEAQSQNVARQHDAQVFQDDANGASAYGDITHGTGPDRMSQ
jgi:hypothetical protein